MIQVLRIAHHAVVSEWRERERELRRQGVDVTLVSARTWNEGGRDVHLDADGDDFVVGARTVGRHPSVFAYDPRPIWRALGSKPDLIDLHEEPNAIATAEVLLLRWLRRSRAPYVLYSAQNIDKRYPVPFRWFERFSLRRASTAYVCNVEAGEILTRKGLGGRAVYIPLGVDLRLFAPADRKPPRAPRRPGTSSDTDTSSDTGSTTDTGASSSTGTSTGTSTSTSTGTSTSNVASTDTRIVGYVGRLEPHKGVGVLLRAAAERPHWQVNLIGDGPERPELEQLARQLGIADRVHFLGFANKDTLAARYRELDVLAVTSLPTPTWLEQFCRVAVEAMASGVPVVASASGAIPDVVGSAGILVEPGDPQALARGVDDALKPSRWKDLRARGLSRANDFTWATVARAQRELYESALGTESAGAATDPEVLVVAYGPPDGLDECLSALDGELPVVVVDNSSLPENRRIAERHGARYLDARSNLGFAGGVNLGLAAIAASKDPATRRRDVLLLNPDARIKPAGVRLMHKALHSAPRIAAVGATQTDPATGGTVRVWWPFPTPAGAWIEAIGLGGFRRRHDFAIGSALLLSRDAIDLVGVLDERFFLYAEETDWQRRARQLGWDIRVAKVNATHEGGGTGGDPSVREGHFYASAELYIRKHFGAAGWQVYRAGNLAGAALRTVLLPGERGAAARRRRNLFLHGPVGVRAGAADRSGALTVAHVVCSNAFAGVERYVLDSARALTAAGCRVIVIGGPESAMRESLEAAGVEWHAAGNVREAFAALRTVSRLDAIITHMTQADLVGVIVGRLRHVPVVSARHFGSVRGHGRLSRALTKALLNRTAGQLAISQFVADSIEGMSTVIHTGVVDVPDVDPKGREPFVLALQRMEPEKQTGLALRAWAAATRPDDWRLVLAGEGSERAKLEALAQRLGIQDSVDFIGFQSDVGALLRRASVLIAPTPREGLGIAVIEAMSYGLPVVAARGGGHLESVGGVQGAQFFAPGDAASAAQRLSTLMSDRAARERYGENLRERQRASFSVESQTAGTVQLLRQVTENASQRAGAQGKPTGTRLVVLSLEPWDDVWRRNQYLVDGLLEQDPHLEVLFVEPPADPAFELMRRHRPHRGHGTRPAAGYHGRLVLHQPTKLLPRLVGPVADLLLQADVRRAIRKRGWDSGVLWVNDLGYSRLVRTMSWPSVYDLTDDWVQADRGEREHRRLVDADAELLALCDEVIVCSHGLELTKGVVRPVHLIQNAVDVDRYRSPTARPRDLPTTPVALYVGTLHEDRLDIDLVLATADVVAGVGGTVLLVGPDALSSHNSRRLSEHAHVTVLGARARDEVPAYLQHAHALIVPHLVNDFTDSLDPIKLYEYLAVGRPIVSTPVAGFRDEPTAVVAQHDIFPTAVANALKEWKPPNTNPSVPTWADRVTAVRELIGALGDAAQGGTR